MERRGIKGGDTALFYPQQQQTTNKNSRHFLFNPNKCDQESSAFKRTAMAIKKKIYKTKSEIKAAAATIERKKEKPLPALS